MDHDDEALGETALLVMVARAEKGLPPGTVDDPDLERLPRSNRETIALSHTFSELPLALKAFRNQETFTLEGYPDLSYAAPDSVEKGENTTQGLRAYSSLDLKHGGTLVLAGSMTDEEYHANTLEGPVPGADARSWDLAAEYSSAIGRRWTYTLGAILTRFEKSGLGAEEQALNPQFAVGYQLSDNLLLRASYAQRIRYPKLRELHDARYGNPDLKAAESDGVDIGLRWTLPAQWRVDAGYYRYEVDKLIEKPARKSPYANLGPSTINGFEVISAGPLAGWGTLTAGFAINHANESMGDGTDRQLRSRPEISGFIDLRADLPARFQLSVRSDYADGLHDVLDDGSYIEVDSAFVTGLRLSRMMSDQVTLYLQVRNAADATWEQKIGYPRPGREFRGGLIIAL